MAMKNPPRRTTIRGQKHLLAYITPEEAQLLMDNGGTGEAGPMGIPSYVKEGAGAGGPAGMGSKSMEGFGGGSNKGGDKGAVDPGLAKAAAAAQKAAAEKATQAALEAALSNDVGDYGVSDLSTGLGMSPGAMGGLIGSAYQTAPSIGGGFDVNLDQAVSRILMAPPTQRLGFTDQQIMKAYQTRKAPGIAGFFGMPLGRTQNYLTFDDPRKGIFSSFQSQAPSFGMPGFIADLFDEDAYVTTGFNQDGSLGSGPQGDGRDVVPAQTNPVTGEQNQCPDGYVFDADLQACRMGGDTGFGTPVGAGPYEPGAYAQMGLLDVAPTGLGMFQQAYGSGFGTPQDFSAANLAFRRRGATRPEYFRRAPDLSGYTLLS